ncbi:hypothetical protein C4587_00985 [Candidatus Parcubacteria bacterium]|nr:MAG: hypothetical protein C4587_00985 [Candidatus Parcubacteria bacterium]
MLRKTFRLVSSYADFSFSDQVVDENGNGVWGDPIPADVVVSFKILPESLRVVYDYGFVTSDAPLISASSDDGSGLITALVNGYYEIAIPRAQMRNLAPDNLNSALRYRLFVNVSTAAGDTQQLVATLPVYRGE